MLIFYKELAQRCTLSSNLPKIYIDDLIVAVEAAKLGVTVGEDTVPGLMFADVFVGVSETPERLQKQIEKALEHTSNSNFLYFFT